ncbi:MAG: alpha-amylase family protein [Sphingobacteriales bacterium]|nr:alpha-amylase family protein [Sphingobacteriales bacterium]
MKKSTLFLSLLAFSLTAKAQVNEAISNHKLVIYQLLPRYFGNTNATNKLYGSKEENGVGKFNDITPKALQELKKLGINYVWYTGVVEHATMTDYTAYGIKQDDPDIVKGKAGSPYAIKDYYDVDPDLAVDVKNRMEEYQNLINRTHSEGLKMIMDFIPNHVARTYQSDAKPAGVIDFGAQDDKTKAYSPQNDYYYIPGKNFIVPAGTDAGGAQFSHPLKDGKFDENPAKVTGNNVFSEKPSIDDWYETMKLNYGYDLQNGKNYLDPVPPVWIKMRDILVFWANKGVDGFRCDVAEFVPVEFWHWVIPEVRKINPNMVFIAEAYDPSKYANYVSYGGFNYMYDKVGLYDALKPLIKNEPNATVADIRKVVQSQEGGLSNHMLRFLENHDEERLASKGFAQQPEFAKAAMVVSATLGSGPVMIYSGQEVGEQGAGIEGFGDDDNRSTIFDYWGQPQHQQWLNGGKFDGGGLTAAQKNLRTFYQQLLMLVQSNKAIQSGTFTDVSAELGLGNTTMAYVRSTDSERVLVLANFNRAQIVNIAAKTLQKITKQAKLKNLLTTKPQPASVKLLPNQALILSF